ncbi:MAG: HAD family hydrolase [Anaerolineae bacterium]
MPPRSAIDFENNFYRAMVLMTVASPCALVISTPASFISAIASAARGGVLFKGGAYLEGLAAIKAITFDKTGTLTIGKPALTDVIAYNGTSDIFELLRLAATAEARQRTSAGKAIVQSAVDRGITITEVSDFEAFAGRGIYALVTGEGGGAIHIGNPGFLSQSSPIPPELDVRREGMEGRGKTVMGVSPLRRMDRPDRARGSAAPHFRSGSSRNCKRQASRSPSSPGITRARRSGSVSRLASIKSTPS